MTDQNINPVRPWWMKVLGIRRRAPASRRRTPSSFIHHGRTGLMTSSLMTAPLTWH